MTEERKLLREAHEAICAIVDSNIFDKESQHYYYKLRDRISTLLATEPEPVAWQMPDGNLIANDSADTVGMWRIGGKPLYAAIQEEKK